MEALGQSICPITSKRHPNSLRGLQKQMLGHIKELQDYCQISEDLALNIVTYAKALDNYGTGFIDHNMFDAQMVRHFGINTKLISRRMYQATKRIGELNVDRCKIRRQVTTDEYTKLVCLFLSNNEIKKTEFVFHVFDIHCSGELNGLTIKSIIKEGLFKNSIDDETDIEVVSTEIYDMIMGVFDLNNDGSISLDEFKNIVSKNTMYTQVLGRCLPNANQVVRFLNKIENKMTMEVAAFFRHERKYSLNTDPLPPKLPMYPIELEMPLDIDPVKNVREKKRK